MSGVIRRRWSPFYSIFILLVIFAPKFKIQIAFVEQKYSIFTGVNDLAFGARLINVFFFRFVVNVKLKLPEKKLGSGEIANSFRSNIRHMKGEDRRQKTNGHSRPPLRMVEKSAPNDTVFT